MNSIQSKLRMASRLMLVAMILLLAFGTISFAQGQRYKSGNEWSFGVHGDTQWTLSNSATGTKHSNKNYVNGELIDLLSQQFDYHRVKFVIQVGDLSDRAGDSAMAQRALKAKSLIDKGIGFFPLRGNHETYGQLYGPPLYVAYDPLYNLNIPAYRLNFPQTQGLYDGADGVKNFGATNFTGPAIDDLKGLSYAFDYDYKGTSATFVIVDVEQTSFKDIVAPNNPASCVSAVTPGTQGTTPFCGQGYLYYLTNFYNWDTGLVVYQATYDILNGVTVYYDTAGNAIAAGSDANGNPITEVPITITTGAWFYIDSKNRPSTDFTTWDMANPDQMFNGAPFDINAPPSDPNNRKLSVKSSANTEYWPGKQQTWISDRLKKGTRNTQQAFVFSHRPLMTANHPDGLFGANPSVSPDDQNVFYASLMDNGVKYMISGHDHIYNRAIVASPDGKSQVEQLTATGASSKFYTPAPLDNFAGAKGRETQISQELNNLGYYIYTVDGPRVTVDYYADSVGEFGGDYCYPHGIKGTDPNRSCANLPGSTGPEVPGTWHVTTADFSFVKKETWGYSTNGQQFIIPQGNSYEVVEGSFGTTTAKILAGTNNSTTTDFTPDAPRALNKTVNTGWVENPAPSKLKSDILSLWGMSELGAYGKTDTYALSMSFAPQQGVHLGNAGGIGTIVSLNSYGEWVNAVDLNIGGGTKQFVSGPYNQKKHGLGTYGFDPSTRSAWAVVNYNADFAVVSNIVTVPPGKAK
jgi:hypothetical protein